VSGRIPWHPGLFAAAVVGFNIVETGAHPLAAGRAFLVAVVSVVILQLALGWGLGGRHRGALAATAVLGVTLAWLPIEATLRAIVTAGLPVALGLATLPLALGLVLVRVGRRRRLVPPAEAVSRGLNAVAVALLVVVVVGAATSPLVAQLPRDIGLVPSPATAAPGQGDSEAQPDIYVFLLDAHPRRDALLEQTGFDLSPFITELASMGFEESAAAHANYNFTEDSLSAFLHMTLRPQAVGDGLGASTGSNVHALRGSLNDNAAFDLLRAHGYDVVAVGPPFEHVALRAADTFVDAGYLNSFECHLIRRTAVGALTWAVAPELIGDVRRAAIQRSLDAAVEVAGERQRRPRFVFVHLPTPHLPVLRDATGAPIDDPRGSDCAPPNAPSADTATIRDAFVATMEHADRLVTSAIRDILARSETEPAVIVMSDHGAHFGSPTVDRSDPAEWRDEFGIVFAARMPGAKLRYPDDVSLVNVLPRLFNAYMGTSLDLSPDLATWPDGEAAPDPADP
jgi:hypothetical protein